MEYVIFLFFFPIHSASLQDALNEKTKRVERIVLHNSKKALNLENVQEHKDVLIESEINILELIETTFLSVMDILSKRDVALFSEMAKTKDEILSCFLSLLHLSNNQRVTLEQEQPFGEIYITAANP